MVNRWLNHIQNSILPRRCILCGDPGTEGMDICAACLTDLPWIAQACPHCGIPVSSTDTLCARCQLHTPRFDRCMAPMHYQYPVDFLVQQFKFKQHLVYGQLLGDLLLRFIQQQQYRSSAEIIIAVPLHPARLRERGFNQSHLLAQRLAAHLGIAYEKELIIRHRATKTQSQLNAKQRKSNVQRAFSLQGSVTDKHIAVIDDVVTTGATVNEISHLLKKHGAAHVEVWCIARA